MKTYIARIITVTALATTSVFAHPGHAGHEDWPFPDFDWSMAIAVIAIIGIASYKLRKKA